MSILLSIAAALIGLPLGLVALFVLLPIRVGASGAYREDACEISGWARACAGLLAAIFEYRDGGGQLRIALGRWTLWRPGEEAGEPEPEPGLPPEAPAAPVVETAREPSVEAPASAPQPKASAPELDASSETKDRSQKPDDASPAAGQPESDRPVATALPDFEEEAAAERKPSWRARLRELRVKVVRYRGYWHRARPILWRLLRRLFRVVGFRSVDLDAILGLEDPSTMGRVFGYVEAVRPLLGPRIHIGLTPDFVRTRFEASGAIEISFSLGRLLWAVVCLAVRGGLLALYVWWAERRAKRVLAAREA